VNGSTRHRLILLPGLMCDHAVWDAHITALADIADGQSMEWDARHTSIVNMAEATLAAAPPRFALAGHSMGGRVAFEIYRRAPERVTHLAVMNTGVPALAPGEAGKNEEAGRRRLLDIAFKDGIRAMAHEWLKGMIPAYRMSDETLVEAIIAMFERKTPELFLIQQEALLGRPDAAPVLATVKCPALALTGQDDVWSPPVRHEEIAAAIPGAQLALIPRSGHMSTMEQPEAVSAAMRAWLLR
jgi:pimeloyl-ACP methyl ester carboxylesterase